MEGIHMDIDNLEEFITIDKRIDTAEEQVGDLMRESLRDRWEFGRLMLSKRRGKKLPDRMLAGLAEVTGKSLSELGYRMRFAERYSTEGEFTNALVNFTSWRQIIKSLPKPSLQGNSKREPAVPKRDPRQDHIAELSGQGLSRKEISEQTGVPERYVRHLDERDRIEQAAREDAATIAWDTIPGNQQVKLERAKVSIRKELEKEFRTRLLAELDQHRAKLDADFAAHKAAFAAHKAAYDAQNARFKTLRDEERRRYQEGIEVQRAKGLITPDDYNIIRSCLHPDSRASVTEGKLAAAFRLFNDSRIKTLLVKEI
jgi:hypothetical protein